VFLALIAALVWSVAAPVSADAQNEQQPVASLSASEASAASSFRTVALGLEAGDIGLAAISGTLSYDADAITVLACEVSEAGACNPSEPGIVRMTAFAANGLRDNERVMTVDFQAVPGATGISTFTFDMEEAVDFRTNDVDKMSVDPLAVTLTEASFGSLTGDVIAADTQIGLFGIDVCALHAATAEQTCTTTSGLGTWRIDDLVTGGYTISFADPAALYATATATAAVDSDAITTGVDAALGFPTDEEPASDAVAEDDTPPPAPVEDLAPVVGPAYVEVSYGATVSGQISDKSDAMPLEGMTVCATQPFVLHQSCTSTGTDGTYTITNLSAGNFWITVTDPLGQYQDSPTKLVGLSSDDAVRTGARIQLDRIGG